MGKHETPVFWLTLEEQAQADQALQRLEVMVLTARRKSWTKAKLLTALQLYLEESTMTEADVG